MSEHVFYCTDGALVEGPVTIQTIRKMLANKTLPRAAMLCLQGEESWKNVDEFFEEQFHTAATFADALSGADGSKMDRFKIIMHFVISPAVGFQLPKQAFQMGCDITTHPDNVHWEVAVFLISQADYFLDCKHKDRRTAIMAIVLEAFAEFAPPHIPVEPFELEEIFNERLAMYGDLSRERAGIEAQLEALALAICMTIEADRPVEGVHGVAELERKGSTTKKRGNLPIQTHMLKPLIMMELADSLLRSGALPGVLAKLDSMCEKIGAA